MALTPEEQLELNDLLRDQEEINARLIEQNRALATASGSERRELENRIASERTRLALTEERRGELERIVEVERQATEEQERQAQLEQERQDSLEESHRYIDEMGQSMARMTKEGKEWLTKSNNGYTQMGSLIATIGELKQQQAGLDGDALARNIEQIGIFEQLGEQMRVSAEQVGEQERMFKGINKDQLERVEFERSIAKLTEEQKIQARELYEINKKLLETEERYKVLNEAKAGLMSQMPEGLQQAVSFGKQLQTVMSGVGNTALAAGIFLLISALVLAIKSFKELDEAAKEFRETTGLTNSQMKGMNDEVNNIVAKYAKFGVNAKDVYETQAALVEEFADFVDYSEGAVAALTAMKQNLGVSAKTSAEVQNIFESVGGLSQDTAASVQMQVANMAKMAKVAPRKVMEDIAESAEAASTFFHGDINALAKAAIEARRLGSNIKEVTNLAETLLDFEGNIEKELKAATFVQGQFNLSKARGLAADNKMIEANQEVLRQLQRSGDFRQKDYWTQKQLADAAGMTVEHINKQLNVQDKLSKLSAEEQRRANEAIEKGLDLSKIDEDQLNTEVEKFAAQQEQAAQLEKINNAFMGMAATIGSTLLPLIEAIGIVLYPIQRIVEAIQWAFGGIGEQIAKLTGPLTMVGKTMKALAGLAVIYAAYSVFGWLTAATMGFGTIAAGAISAAILTAGFATLSKIGDLNSPADGKTRVSTKEGGLFELSPNDDLVAAPGAANALAGTTSSGMKSSMQSAQGNINVVFPKEAVNSIVSGIKSNLNGANNTSNTTETNLQTIQTNTPTNSVQTQTNELATATQTNTTTTNTNTTTPSGLSGLSVPLNAMIEELKALRADMASGKIGVFMDGSKVTAGIAKQVDKNTRNHYSMA